jgi:hypothetical protein
MIADTRKEKLRRGTRLVGGRATRGNRRRSGGVILHTLFVVGLIYGGLQISVGADLCSATDWV